MELILNGLIDLTLGGEKLKGNRVYNGGNDFCDVLYSADAHTELDDAQEWTQRLPDYLRKIRGNVLVALPAASFVKVYRLSFGCDCRRKF